MAGTTRLQKWIRRFKRRHPIPIWGHALLLGVYIPGYAYLLGMEEMHTPDLISKLLIAGSQVLCFYLAIFVFLPRAFRYKRHPGISALWVVVYLAVVWLLVTALLLAVSLMSGAMRMRWEAGGEWFWDVANFGMLMLMTCYLAMVASLGYQLLAQLLIVNRHQNNLRHLIAHKRAMVTILELEWRRAQLDPHLLAGLLSRVRLMSQLDKENTWKAINRVIAIMRYYCALPPGTDAVPIDEEMEQVENLIALENFGKGSVYVNITYALQNRDRMVIPMLLLMLMENQLKYGIVTDLNAPALLCVSDGDMAGPLFVVTLNHVKKRAKGAATAYGGQGMTNISARLKHYYHRHQLEYGLDTEGRYRVEMHLYSGI